MLVGEMGMGLASCVRAMQASSNNVDAAAEWLFANMDQEQARTEEVRPPACLCVRVRVPV